MKTAIKFLTILMMAFTFVACGGKDGDKRTRVRSGDRGDRVSGDATGGSAGDYIIEDLDQVNGSHWGQIYKGGSTQDQFQENVMRFASASMDPYSSTGGLGFVSGDLGQDTGIWFSGQVQFTGGSFNGTSSTATVNLSTSQLAIVVWDNYASQYDSNNQLVGEYGFAKRGASFAEINGNSATVEWEDSFGHVWLEGQFNNEWFEGDVYYYNKTNESSQFSGPQNGWLGRFYVPTCGFFACN